MIRIGPFPHSVHKSQESCPPGILHWYNISEKPMGTFPHPLVQCENKVRW